MRWLIITCIAFICTLTYGQATPSPYPHALFAFEAGSLGGAVFEDTRSYHAYENQSIRKFSAINIPIAVGASFLAFKLQNSPRKPLRVLGHIVMIGAVTGYSVDYFRRAEEK